jgi:ElaB/YqjD/DUF883 family membrane-anchored ribosome-binding protein
MADYKKRFEKWQKDAKERFDDFDKQIGLKDKLAEGAKVAVETAQKGAETLRDSAEKIKHEAEKTEVGKQAVKVAEGTYKAAEKVAGETVKTAGETAKKAWEASEPVREAAEDASERAGDVFESASKNTGEMLRTVSEKASEVFAYAGERAGDVFGEAQKSVSSTARSVSNAFNFGASWTRTINSAFKTVQNTADWITEKPLQAATTGASIAVGAGLGVVFTGISSHWFFSSMIPAWSVRKVSEEFNKYLKTQEELVIKGDLTKAEAERIQFEREIVKYVGAPLLGAFSFASGAVLMTNVVNPKTVTGAPVDWILRGNPLLEGAWYFGNGLFCFKTGYDFFMISLEDDEDVQKIVKELKGFLPQTSQAETV